uniref:Uncharacterized protein n=1 Tax=Curvibacter symbiont subsp. Hydra magnipapillata TaxID=667019 RepID=C9YGS5_CURXX|nr:hypothetical protein Csp_B19750 [Curvibacter putative symbiont of Hydra magnipapillata]
MWTALWISVFTRPETLARIGFGRDAQKTGSSDDPVFVAVFLC